MLLKLLFVSLLLFSTQQLRSETSSTQALRPISTVNFGQGEIFFMSRDRQNFGHIQKQNGALTLNWFLSSGEKVVSQTEHQVLVTQGQEIAQYSVFEKVERTIKGLRAANVTSYEGYQSFKFGFYFYADGQLFLNQWRKYEEDEQINYQLDQNEQFIQMESFNQLLLIFTTTADSICFTQVDLVTVNPKKCLSRISSGNVHVEVSGKYLYVIYAANKIQLLDKDFNVIQTFFEPIVQLSKGSATFAGFKTFDIDFRAMKDWKLVAHNHEGPVNTLELVSGEYILKEGDRQIAKIVMPSEPVGLWLNKKEAAIGRIQGKYELLAQFSTGSLNFYEIRAIEGTNPTVVLKWSH